MPHYSKSYNKRQNVTYVYEVLENYYDKEKKQARNKRRLVGRIDPETGQIVPTKPRGKKADDTKVNPDEVKDNPDYKKLYESALKDVEEKTARITELEQLLREYLDDDVQYFKDTEDSVKQRRIKAEQILRHKI